MSIVDSMERTARGCGVVLLIVATVTMTCGIFGLVYYFTTPEGEAVGGMPGNGTGIVRVTLAPGDTLHFVVAYSHPVMQFGFAESPARDSAIERALRTSRMRVVATPVGGTGPIEATCAPYNGRTGTVIETSGQRSVSGGLTDCVIAITSAGAYDVTGTITWSSELRADVGTIEVRRATPER